MKRERSTFSLFVAGTVILILLNLVGFLRPLENLVAFALQPITGLLDVGAEGDDAKTIELEKRLTELRTELAAREEAKLQNDALRDQLNFARANNYQLVHGRVISQDPTNFQQIVTINRGSSGGIGKGMVAISGGLLIGKVVETTATTSKVYLITDFNSAVPALDQQTRSSGVVRGTRGYGLALEMVQQTDQLKSGDTLITSGFGGEYPAGLVIGTIGEIKRRDTDVFQTAQVTPGVDFRKLENVFIITGQS